MREGYVPASEDWSTALGQQVLTVRYMYAPDQAPAVIEALANPRNAVTPAGPDAQAIAAEKQVKQAPPSSRELLIVGGGILLAIFLVPFGGPQAPVFILLIALLVVFDIARGRRRAGK